MKSRLNGYISARLLLFILFVAPMQDTSSLVFAQAGQSELTGTVQDEEGAGVAGASVTAIEVNTNVTTLARTNDDGAYTVTNIKPGLYNVTIEAAGFRRFQRAGVTLTTGERIRVDVALNVGSVEEVVTVSSDASLLRTETGSLGQVIPNRIIVELPLNGRNFLSLVALSPGVAQPPPTSTGPSLPRIGGGRPRTNEYLFDGISALQPEPGQVVFFPIVDAIQEFKVEINSPSAEFGRFNGGVVNLTTKAGTNDFHGSAFEFFRNEVLNARNLFAPATPDNLKKPVFRRNQYGFVIGGPIVKDKTFFFGDFQGTRQIVGRTLFSTVPTLAQRQGIFAQPIYDPATTRARTGGGFVRDQFDNNRIPLSRIDPVALQLLNRYPLPNLPGTANNYRRTANERISQDQFDVRLDQRFSDHDQLFGRYSFFKDTSTPVTPLPDGSGNITTGTLGLQDTRAQQIIANYVHVFSTTLVNELRFGYSRRSVARNAQTQNTNASQSFSINGIPSNAAFGNTLPTFTIAGLQQLGASANTNSRFNTDVTQVFDSVNVQLGRHSTKYGVDFRRERLNVLQPPQPTGVFAFNTLGTNQPGITNTGNSFASFLLGQVQNFSIDLQRNAIRPRATILEFFAQDDYKAAPRLTLNLGLRYTLNFPSTEASDQGAILNLQTGLLDYLGRNNYPDTARELHKLNFGPRLGIAYRLTDKTVLRSGLGITFIEQAGITTPFTIPQFPFIQTVTQRSLDGINPAFVLSTGASVQPIPLTPTAGYGQGVFSVDRDLGSGYVTQWNVAAQRELRPNLVAEVAYAGSKITHVGIPDTNINQLTPAQLALGQTLLQQVPNPFFGQIPRSSSLGDPTIPRAQLLRAFPQYTTVSLYRNNVGNTNYNSLQAKLEQRFSRGLSLLVAYTRSKLIDEASSVFDASILTGPVANFPVADSFNRKLERDVSTGDIPNVFVASFTYELPFGKHRFFNFGGISNNLLGGWSVTGVVTLQSGVPIAVTQATNFNAFAGFGTQRPNRVADPNLPAARQTTARFFDTSAFTIAPQFALGNSSRNPVRGPHYHNADLAFIKRIRVGETRNLEFRTEIFNLPNTPPLSAPNGVAGSPAFGTITSAGDPRVVQFGAKVNF